MAEPNNNPEENKNATQPPAEVKEKEHSVMGDLVHQGVETIIKPKLKETTNNMFSELIYMVADFFTSMIAKKIFGPDAAPVTRNKNGNGQKTNYSGMSKSQSKAVVPRASDEVAFCSVKSRQKADAIQQDLINYISTYGKVRAADLYEKINDAISKGESNCDKINIQFTDYQYGWKDVNDISFDIKNGQWVFTLAKPVLLRENK